MPLIGLVGPRFCGKTTIAKELENHGYARQAFAGPLKEGCAAVFGLTDRQLYGDQKEEKDAFWGMTPRHILQHVGTDLFRRWRPDIWIRAAERRMGPNTVMEDCRFRNEAALVKQKGGYVIRLVRGPRKQDAAAMHASEMEQWSIESDITVDNNGDMKDTVEAILMFIEHRESKRKDRKRARPTADAQQGKK